MVVAPRERKSRARAVVAFEERDAESEWQDGDAARAGRNGRTRSSVQTFNGLRIVERGQRGQFETLHTPNLFAAEIATSPSRSATACRRIGR